MIVDLRRCRALVSRLHGRKDVGGIDAPSGRAWQINIDANHRSSGRRRTLDVDRARHLLDDGCDTLGCPVQRIGIAAIDADRERSGLAGKRFSDAIAEKGKHLGGKTRIAAEHLLNLVLHVVLGSTGEVWF